MNTTVNIALPKGRIGKASYDVFAFAGFECIDFEDNSRKLIFDSIDGELRFFRVKPSDVSIYVERGAADIGVVGKDVLMENDPDVYELMDLDEGKCRMMVAAPRGFRDNVDRTLRVATKYPVIASQYYSGKGRDIEIIELNGSIEIAPLLGLSDVIVDLVQTGNTLKANDLEPIDVVAEISARLIANKASLKFKIKAIEEILDAIRGKEKKR